MDLEKIVMFTPLPPSKTGIADYMVEVGMELEKHLEVIYVIADNAPPAEYEVKNGTILSYSDFKVAEELAEVPRVYQMGNNVQHEYILKELLIVPSLVVLHDYSMHHLFAELTLARGDERQYKALMTYNYNEYGEAVAEGRLKGEFNEILQFILPLNQTVIDAALGIIVHSYESFYRARKVTDHQKVCKIDFPYNQEQNAFLQGSVTKARQQLNIDEDAIIFASFGFVTPPKQIEFVLKALSEIRDEIPSFKYYIVGEVSDAVPIQQLLLDYELTENVVVLGYVDFEQLHLHMEASDIVVSLRYPSAGETSAALYRAMGVGKCCLVFDYSSYSDLPDNTLIKIKLDTFDVSELQRTLKHYAHNMDEIVEIAANAKQYIDKKHSVDICVQQYLDIIKQFCTTNITSK